MQHQLCVPSFVLARPRQEGISRRESAQGASEHEPRQPAITARNKKQTSSLVAALRKGGVRFPLPVRVISFLRPC